MTPGYRERRDGGDAWAVGCGLRAVGCGLTTLEIVFNNVEYITPRHLDPESDP